MLAQENNRKQKDTQKKIESYIDDDLELEQISLEKGKSKNFFLSINIYNVTSPILNTLNTVTRCEINTYVKIMFEKNLEVFKIIKQIFET